MKRKINLLILALIIILTVLSVIKPYIRGKGYDSATIYEARQNPQVSDSLPHYEYRRKLDSFKSANPHLEEKAHYTRGGTQFLDIWIQQGADSNEYYLGLPDYNRFSDVKLFRKGKKNYISEYVWDSTWIENGLKHASGRRVMRETPLQYVETDEMYSMGRVLIPISKTTFNFWNVVLNIMGLLVLVISLVIVIGGTLRLLLDIAKGKAFTIENIGRLYRIATLFIIVGLLPIILRLALHLAYTDLIPDTLSFVWVNWLRSGSGYIISGLIILLFANAFRHGYELQKDRDLSI